VARVLAATDAPPCGSALLFGGSPCSVGAPRLGETFPFGEAFLFGEASFFLKAFFFHDASTWARTSGTAEHQPEDGGCQD
jgi:hypothetical protein